ncbi:DoxX family membrane protein [Geomonas sp. Red69]|uniref:DoxX family membrane protein n=1 Tax=Geomonas diazotrophica TaxID=2843197 RepID=A0ABX8JI24_9BACT|nr:MULTISPECIES: MauE/DoxX family redox-associated membrane protein [Geomonas]MBU5635734.1 DoxX family membrane protein [Geomonas diazotrophica]QWV98030.1 DoxX family membrane protein [Geomonas nitrogeniifigens]QXE87161.1 DoxX family membrane protein [Geomonas nitrogeniifigens]
MKLFHARMIPVALRVALGAIFIYAAVPKIADPVAFAGSVAAYRILPYFWSYLTAAVLPFLELLCGVLLVCGVRVRSGALIIGVLNLVFMVALASAMIRGLDIDCGCFRPEGAKTAPWVALLRDTLFLFMTAIVIRHERLQVRSPLPERTAFRD